MLVGLGLVGADGCGWEGCLTCAVLGKRIGRLAMRSKCYSIRRYRRGMCGIAFFVGVYLCVAGVSVLIHRLPFLSGLRMGASASEIFPFFAWMLYSVPPSWEKTDFAVVVHSAGGEAVGEAGYMVPRGIKHNKYLKRLRWVAEECVRRPERCEGVVRQLLYPIVRSSVGEGEVEFSLVRVKIDLREIRVDIKKIAEGKAAKVDYYRVDKTIGRWRMGKDASAGLGSLL